MDRKLIDHYRTYLKIYGWMIISLADDDAEVLRLIECDTELSPLLLALRDRIRQSPVY